MDASATCLACGREVPTVPYRTTTEYLEAAVIGCLIAPDGIRASEIHLTDADMSLPEHADIYRAIMAIEADGEPHDAITVYGRLRRHAWAISRALCTPVVPSRGRWYARELGRSIAIRREAEIRAELAEVQRAGADVQAAARDAARRIADVWDRYCPRQDDDTTVVQALSEMMLRVRTGEAQPALMTGVAYLDRMTLGLCPGESVILGGRPGTGKTDLALNIIVSMARHRRRVGLISIEMMPQQLIERIASMVTMLDAVAMLRQPGRAATHDREALIQAHGQILDIISYIDTHTQGVSTWPEIERRLRACVERGAELLVVDHLHQIVTAGRDKRVEISQISCAWKALLKELRVPGIMLCHLSRAMEAEKNRKPRPPRLSDLRESGAIEGDADYVWLLHQGEPGSSERLLIQAKGRQRPTGYARLRHSGASHWLWEIEEDGGNED